MGKLRTGIEEQFRGGQDPANWSYGPNRQDAPVFPDITVTPSEQSGANGHRRDSSNPTDGELGYHQEVGVKRRNRPARGRGY